MALCAGAVAADDHPGAAAAYDSTNAILPDPDIHLGTLPNGLHYAVMRNSTPKRALSLRLAVEVGEFEEEPAERGTAHFVEHMAYSGGENAHEAGLETKFAQAGVEFGRDQNARTGSFSTVYELDLPNDEPSSLDLAFAWLRKVADGATFSQGAVDRERSIILAERQVRLGPGLLAREDDEKFLMPNLRSARADSIGSPDQLRTLNAAALQSFYRRWYRPDNAFVVAVGDEPVDLLEQRIRGAFGSWQGEGAKPARPAFGAPDERRGLEIRTRDEPRLSESLSICRVRAANVRGADDVIRLRESLLTTLWVDILNRRLGTLTKPDDAPFLSSTAYSSDVRREARETCIVTVPLLDTWKRALRSAEIERRRFALEGPTQQEVDDAVDAERARFRGTMRSSATRMSSGLAADILDKLLVGDVAASPTEEFRAFDAAIEHVLPRDVSNAFAKDWSGGGPLITVSTRGLAAPGAVRRAWDEAERAPLGASPQAAKPAVWAYTNFGSNGHVAKREAIASPEFVRVTFDNGVVLNFKHTDFEREAVKVRLQFGAGRREIPDRQFVAAEFGSQLFAYMGLGRNDIQDLQQLFIEKGWDATLDIQNDAFVLKGATSPRDLKTQLQILTAFVSDPGFKASANARLPTLIDYLYRGYRSQPGLVLRYALKGAIGGKASLGLPSRRELLELRSADLAHLLKPALIEAPLEVTIVGDVDEAEATEYVAETVGALPARPSRPRERGDTAFLRFPDRPVPLVRTTHEGPTDIAVVGADWPLYVATPQRRREEVSLMLLQKVFDNRLRHRVRQEMGRSYAPSVTMLTPDHADQGYIQALVETSPGDADLVRGEIRDVAARLARGEISDEEVEAARNPIVADFAARMRTNDWWVGGLDGSARQPERLEEMGVMMPLLTGVTPQEVRKAAADWLTRAPVEILALPAEAHD